LDNKTELEERIGEFRKESIYNIGEAEDYIVKNIRFILENETHPDWQYVECPIVPRDKPEIPEGAPIAASLPDTYPEPTLIEEGYRDFNIIAYDGMYYGLAQGEGTFDMKRVTEKKYQRYFEATSVNKVKRLIDQDSPTPPEK